MLKRSSLFLHSVGLKQTKKTKTAFAGRTVTKDNIRKKKYSADEFGFQFTDQQSGFSPHIGYFFYQNVQHCDISHQV